MSQFQLGSYELLFIEYTGAERSGIHGNKSTCMQYNTLLSIANIDTQDKKHLII